MAKLTKEEKAALLEKQLAEDLKAAAEFRQSMPKRLFELTAAAQAEGVRVETNLTETGPEVKFYFTEGYDADVITYETEFWIVESVEDHVSKIRQSRIDREARKILARTAFNKLTEEEKSALKEFIWNL